MKVWKLHSHQELMLKPDAPRFEICPSCGTEFGYDDAKESHAELRERWLAGGARWSSRAKPSPPNWDGMEQLKTARLEK